MVWLDLGWILANIVNFSFWFPLSKTFIFILILVWPTDLEKIFAKLNNLNPKFGFAEGDRPFIYQAVVDSGGEAISK